MVGQTEALVDLATAHPATGQYADLIARTLREATWTGEWLIVSDNGAEWAFNDEVATIAVETGETAKLAVPIGRYRRQLTDRYVRTGSYAA